MPRLMLTSAGKLELRWNSASCSNGYPNHSMYECYRGSIPLFPCNMAAAASHVSLLRSHASYLSANQCPGMTAKASSRSANHRFNTPSSETGRVCPPSDKWHGTILRQLGSDRVNQKSLFSKHKLVAPACHNLPQGWRNKMLSSAIPPAWSETWLPGANASAKT